MAEYIERKVVINRIKKYALDVYDIDLDDAKQFGGNSLIENYCEGLYEATELVDDIPAADVAPVIHGRWIDAPLCGNDNCRCSNCGSWHNIHVNLRGEITQKYCPNCGAKMDGGTSDAKSV